MKEKARRKFTRSDRYCIACAAGSESAIWRAACGPRSPRLFPLAIFICGHGVAADRAASVEALAPILLRHLLCRTS